MWEHTWRTPDDLLELVGIRRKEMYKAEVFTWGAIPLLLPPLSLNAAKIVFAARYVVTW